MCIRNHIVLLNALLDFPNRFCKSSNTAGSTPRGGDVDDVGDVDDDADAADDVADDADDADREKTIKNNEKHVA